MIRIDAMWLAADPIDMRASAERLSVRVVQVFGAAQARHGYLFANARGTRVKLLVHDGFGVWCAARRLNAGRFVWPSTTDATPLDLGGGLLDYWVARAAGYPANQVMAIAAGSGGGLCVVSDEPFGGSRGNREIPGFSSLSSARPHGLKTLPWS